MNALFITNQNDLSAKVNGGVQLCSIEYLNVIKILADNVSLFLVSPSKKPKLRLYRKIGIDSYHLYDFETVKERLYTEIEVKKIDTIFINKCELIKVARLIKQKYSNILVVIMSHGNESGDYLKEVVMPSEKINPFSQVFRKMRLGLNIYTESYYRQHYVDLVCVMSEEESAIEKWLGAKNVFFFPRIIKSNILNWQPTLGKLGFVGTLNHKPNLDAINQICALLSESGSNVEVILVGNPKTQGELLASKFTFVRYLGALPDVELEREVSSWMYFLNPIFWYSRGASMKLATALGWGIPIITSTAGMRGYRFKSNILLSTNNNAKDFAKCALKNASDLNNASLIRKKVLENAKHWDSAEDIASNLLRTIAGLQTH